VGSSLCVSLGLLACLLLSTPLALRFLAKCFLEGGFYHLLSTMAISRLPSEGFLEGGFPPVTTRAVGPAFGTRSRGLLGFLIPKESGFLPPERIGDLLS